MNYKIVSEFDSFDDADLATAKVRHMKEVINIKTTKAKFSDCDVHGNKLFEEVVPIAPAGAAMSTMAMDIDAVVLNPLTYSNNNQNSDNELCQRRDVQVVANTTTKESAHKIASVFICSKGHNVKTIEIGN